MTADSARGMMAKQAAEFWRKQRNGQRAFNRPERGARRDARRLGRTEFPLDDGIVLRADLSAQGPREGKFPVLLSYGAFGKGLAFQAGNTSAWIA